VNYYDLFPGLRRFVVAFLIAVILAVVFYAVNASAATVKPKPQSATQDVMVQPFDGCKLLEPYGYWWFFWGCNEGR
jgi:hypothetical protein